MQTTDDLRALLSEQAGSSSVPRPSAAAAIRLGRRLRTRRRLGLVAGTLAVVGVVAVPTVISWPENDAPPPADQTPGPLETSGPPLGSGWVESIPGLDLPQGDALTTPYAAGSEVYADGKGYNLAGEVTELIEVPAGLVVQTLTGPRPGHQQPRVAERLELLVDDGVTVRMDPIDMGFIDTVRATVTSDGETLVAWSWGSDPDVGPTEIRMVRLGSGDAPQRLAVEPSQTVQGFVGSDVLVLPSASSSGWGVSRWDGGDHLVPYLPMPSDDTMPLALDVGEDGGLAVLRPYSTPCIVAVELVTPAIQRWELCDEGGAHDIESGSITVRPDGLVGVGQVGVIDLDTGEVVVQLGLGATSLESWSSIDGPLSAYVVGWSGDDVLLRVSYAGPAQTTQLPDDDDYDHAWITNPLYVGVRCSTASGACARVPHAMDVVGRATP